MEEEKSNLYDSIEQPRFGAKNPEQESKIYSVKDNPFVRNNTPNKTVKSVVTESKVSNIPAEESYVVIKPSSPEIKQSSVADPTWVSQVERSPTSVTSSSKPNADQESKIDTGRDIQISKSKTKEATKGIKGTVEDGWHSLDYENGTYEGYIKDNKRNGKGRYTWHDGNRYEGDWVDDQKEGMGKFSWTTGDVYEGEYKADKRHGVGVKNYNNGDSYEVWLRSI